MIEKSILLSCTDARAFTLFTSRISAWWPPERRHTNDPASELFLLATGRFYERARDGREVELGRVLEWAPPTHLLLDFYPGTDAEHPTRVEVRFIASSSLPPTTLVKVIHRAGPDSEHLFGARAPRYAASWDLVLPALERHARELEDW
ncbi:hypothetical protein OV208_24475 [Corallococcus sp. bb12-1]|uniref:hypothetical protein n=1 Tax=Corallococcus sp. bb12-1 TaxID=2996784 RepID=UPI00226EE937|nr:hypothetical protein [Corallococcus sp. bb12-1]MCY1044498.1 hypothetical protein [Corallococcus sp. bb12-1]